MDSQVVCNYRNCRKVLVTGKAWVTSCSHMFCHDDGERLRAVQERKCPVCSTQLAGKFDLVQVDINPSESYKSMALCGQKPEVILDICTRAIAFWMFQVRQEKLYKEYESKKLREKYTKIEQYSNKLVSNWKIQSKGLNAELQRTKAEFKELQKQYTEANSLLREKTRELQKLQVSYSAQKRTSIPAPEQRHNHHITSSHPTLWPDVEMHERPTPKRSSSVLDDFVMHFGDRPVTPPERDTVAGGFNAEEFCFNASHPPSPFVHFNQAMSVQKNPLKGDGFPRKLF
ncbi:E3 ubiquitin-protein ligase CCNB1IP1-like isoform X1 [Ciona intestinalis]